MPRRRDGIRSRGAFLLLALILAAPNPALGRSSPPPALSERILLARLADPAAALAPLPVGARVSEFSSHDLLNGNFDGGSYSLRLGHPLTFVRCEAGGYVLLDQAGQDASPVSG